MAERPDLEYWVPLLHSQLAGSSISGAEVRKAVVLRQAIDGQLSEILAGQRIVSVNRRGHFIQFEMSEGVEMVISCMLAGRFDIVDDAAKKRADIAIEFPLEDGRILRYRDSVQMGKVYVIPTGEYAHVPGFERIGIDVLNGRSFTKAAFKRLAAKRRDQVRVFLMDKSAIDSLGNAYADEVLFEAGIHPKTWVRSLSEDDLEELHRAIKSVLANANKAIKKAKPPLDVKLRDFLKVRNRHKEPCLTCQTPIRKAGVRGFDSFFCPTCQPETRKGSIVSWGKKPRNSG